ncbi:MAG TPA: helix-turn-helix domain-containing protein [Spirillospora sp.]|nr:helix-turn-helix domain-containing protein [Spirillospora sp.]
MADEVGKIIKRVREQKGWGQSELAKHLDVSQQTVSRWERGLSRPTRPVIGRLAEVLELDVAKILHAAGYVTATANRPEDINAPVRPRSITLPLHELPPDRFEQFSADLAQALYPNAEVHRYGGQGHKQGGIDVLVTHPIGKPTGIQCKREGEFGPAKVKAAVSALEIDLKECIIFLTRVASPQARKEISKQKDWKLWDIEDISRTVRTLGDTDAALRLVDTYFPQWREAFLGISAPGPWQLPEEFFRPFSGDQIYTHDWKLVGRSNEIADLRAFLDNADQRAAAIVGRGGIGKTRILRALSTETEFTQPTQVRFLAAGVTVEPQQYDLLPPDERLLVIVDDAHDRTDIAAIISRIRHVRPHGKVLLSLRPQGLDRLTAELRQAGIHSSELKSWRIEDLPKADAEVLAQEALGDAVTSTMAQRLAAGLSDCPLLLVVGASLIRRRQLDPRMLEASESIRAEIMTQFQDAVAVDPATGDPEVRRETLKAVAAMQPIRIEDPAFREALANLVGRSFDQIMPHLNGLQNSGILMRRGTSFRIVPDLLGDIVLAEAAMDLSTGISTGYLERVYEAASDESLQHAFINASRVDWQVRQDSELESPLVGSLWERLTTSFYGSDLRGRLALLGLLEKVAIFQPARTLALVRWAIDNPTDVIEIFGHPLLDMYKPSYDDIIKDLPKILEKVGYHLNYLSTTADLLWDLARHDKRPLNQFPYHPIRILSNLASYDLAKPISFQEVLVSSVERWIARGRLEEWPYSPFEVVKPLLQTEAEIRRSDGLSITLRTVPVEVDAVAELRGRILDLAFAEARSDELKRAVDAVSAIEEAIIYPSGLYGRAVSEEERSRWTPRFVEIIERLGNVLAWDALDPAIWIAVNRVLRWHSEYSSTATKDAARTVLANSPLSIECSLAKILYDGRDGASHSDAANESSARNQSRLEDIVSLVIGRWSNEEIIDRLEERLAANYAAFGRGSGNPGPFVWTLVRERPAIGELVCRKVIAKPARILQDLVPVTLVALTLVRPLDSVALARQLAASKNIDLQRRVAQAFGPSRASRAELIDGEYELLRSLILSSDATTRRLVIAAARSISANQRTLALQLITEISFVDSAEVAEELAGVFGPGGLTWSELGPAQADRILDQLRKCPAIEGYQVGKLLASISGTNPSVVLDLLKDRVEASERASEVQGYSPLPRQWHEKLRFRESTDFVKFMRSIIEWMANGHHSWRRQREGAEIFAAVAEDFDEQVVEVITEAIERGDKAVIKATGSVLSKAPAGLVYENVEFVAKVIRVASLHGDECVQAIGGGLHSAVSSGARWGTPGQPFREDIEQRDKSMHISQRLPIGSVERRFYQSLQASAESRIRWEEEHDRGVEDGRDW